jgi:DNA-binding PadR family transcriptional regulator
MADAPLDALLPLTPTVYHILVALADGASHGYAVAREVEELTGGRIVMGPGTLYGSLKRMEESELIREVENPGEDGLHAERRRYYALTPLGRQALAEESERLLHAVRVAQARLAP